MKLKYIIPFVGVILILVIIACSPDENTAIRAPERDRAEQQMADKDSLVNYLSTHYYNSGFFEAGSNHTYSDIVITELPKDDNGNYEPLPNPDENTLLIDAVGEPLTTEFAETEYEYYVLNINQGGGDSPAFTDFVRVRYEGSLVTTSEVFDESNTPFDIILQGNGFDIAGAIRGWQLVLPEFNTSENVDIEDDGQVTFTNHGLGVMFLPSGLGYYSGFLPGIPPYSNLVFKFDLLQAEAYDHDVDLVFSSNEDRNNNQNAFDDDTDEDGIPDFLDTDDDGDGIGTRFEDIDGDGDPTNDIGINGIPKYLDPEETESNQTGN